jgi:hypothetical protein
MRLNDRPRDVCTAQPGVDALIAITTGRSLRPDYECVLIFKVITCDICVICTLLRHGPLKMPSKFGSATLDASYDSYLTTQPYFCWTGTGHTQPLLITLGRGLWKPWKAN